MSTQLENPGEDLGFRLQDSSARGLCMSANRHVAVGHRDADGPGERLASVGENADMLGVPAAKAVRPVQVALAGPEN
jgi:hypothetical protein